MKTPSTSDQAVLYRRLIDRLVHGCRKGQGTIAPARVRQGIWNANTEPDRNTLPDDLNELFAHLSTKDRQALARKLSGDDHAINELLARLPAKDRRVIARMLSQAFVSGIHWALVVLHEDEIQPFHDGYLGTPFHDFISRLDGVSWKVLSKPY